VIDEVLRHSSIVPDGVLHRAVEDKELRGYFIPKGAWIMTNMFHMHHDPAVFEDPEVFKPERFLSPDGKKYQKNENLMPFQIGRRQCVGEILARDTIFLFLTNIFQRFDISFDPALPEPTMELDSTFLLNPLPYSLIMKDRLQ
jgi:cytochrome P450